MDPRKSYASLVKGVHSFDLTGGFYPGELLLIGDNAFPVLVSTNGQVLIASSQYGKGRMVVVPHENILNSPQLLPFIKNAVQWLKPSMAAQVGVHSSLDPLSQMLLSSGVKVQTGATLGTSLGVYCTDAYDETHADDLVKFVKSGGGLLIGGQAWNWATQYGTEKVLLAFPGNRVTSVAGVYFTGNVGENGIFPVSKEMPRIPLITQHGLDIQSDLNALLNGVTEFNIQDGVPSPLLIHGTLAFPVGMDDSQQSFLAAAHYGRGRIVVASHENQFTTPSMKEFVLNAIHWLSSGKGGKVGIGDNLQELYSMLDQAKIPSELTDLKDGLSVYCCMTYSDREVEKIHEFVSEGGGLLIGGQAWSWVQENNNTNAEYPGNKILNTFGISVLGTDINSPNQTYPAGKARDVASCYHFRQALFQFQQHIQNKQSLMPPYSTWVKKLGQDSDACVQLPFASCPSFSSIHQVLMEIIQLSGIPDISASKPIQSNSPEALLISLSSELYNNFSEFQKLVPKLNQHLATDYPVSPPQTIRINGRNDGAEAWRSTGLYVPPGKTTTLLFPSSVISAKLQVQIGCHSDDLSNAEELKRAPIVIRKIEVKTPRMEVSSLWGGLLYVIVPEKSSVGHISVTVKGAVQAPYFKNGETSTSAWKNTIRHYPAPWAELETENIILTVPADDVRNIENPQILLTNWDKMMKAVAKLSSIPAIFPRPERIVADVQISVGWMHSGYPIMLHLDSVHEMTDVKSIHANGLWGPIHELGHNQQQSGWDFPPHTTEATCNLWSVYVNETVFNVPRERAHEELSLELRKRRIEDYIQNGAQLKDFEMFTALEPYLQVQETFGWEPYMHIFAEYRKMTQIPEDNESKMNLWVEKLSPQVGHDLAPFFKVWGWPITDELSQKLARSFPPWVENPMKQYMSP
ncbi:TRPM8 channel-associated factor 2-like [Hemicordylus capensis]|uniref:TRPM8 channel-associated factor 2-like n=1 Tax=Hemicordylus capensis TaxID=884348 RepID=UPI0023047DEF|nr:TRPM8 channel-associated factor 2-like [Hemicordylus capensis]